jgi:hypothetical protein
MEDAFRRRPWLLPIVLAVLVIIFLRPVILPPKANYFLDGQDFRDMFYPLHEYIAQTLGSGELPLWNPHTFIGHPIIGNPHAALFYPGTWFMWLVGVERGMNLVLVFHTWLGAWGMALLARNFKASYIGSLLAGVIFAMGGFAGARYYAGHYNLLVVFAWIPWAMLAYLYALTHLTLRATLPGILVMGFVLLAGHPPTTVYLILLLVTLAGYYVFTHEIRWQAAWDAGRQLVLIGLGGAILGAALVIPVAELTVRSARSNSDESFNNSYYLPPEQYLMLIAPNLFGNPKEHEYWGVPNFEEYLAYVGIIPLLAIPLAFRHEFPDRAYWIGLIALGIVMSAGLDGVLTALLWRWVPGFSFFRVPARSLLFFVVGSAGLTAQLVTFLQTASPQERQNLLQAALRRWLPATAIILFVLAILFAGVLGLTVATDSAHHAAIVGGALANTGLVVVGVWVVLWLWTSAKPDIAKWALLATCGFIILDVWHVSLPLITVSAIKQPPLWVGASQIIPHDPDARVDQALTVNLASVTGLYNVQGYDPLPIEAFRQFEDVEVNPLDSRSRFNMLLGVKYIMADRPLQVSDIDVLGTFKGNFYYRIKDALPRAWLAQSFVVMPDEEQVDQTIVEGNQDLQKIIFVDQPVTCPAAGGTATITQYRPNDVEIKTSGSGMLTLSDQYYPGWQATIDGQPTTIYRADTIFRSVCVPAGDHVIHFAYRPTSIVIGMIISAIGWLCAAIIVFDTAIRWIVRLIQSQRVVSESD